MAELGQVVATPPARSPLHRFDPPLSLPTPQGVGMKAHFTGGDSDRDE
jgi:hypothetical protein